MALSDEDFEMLKNDIREIISVQVSGAHIKRNSTGAWSRFAEIQLSSNTYARDIVCTTELLDENGYVTSIRQDHAEHGNRHRTIMINVTITYDVYNRVLGDE